MKILSSGGANAAVSVCHLFHDKTVNDEDALPARKCMTVRSGSRTTVCLTSSVPMRMALPRTRSTRPARKVDDGTPSRNPPWASVRDRRVSSASRLMLSHRRGRLSIETTEGRAKSWQEELETLLAPETSQEEREMMLKDLLARAPVDVVEVRDDAEPGLSTSSAACVRARGTGPGNGVVQRQVVEDILPLAHGRRRPCSAAPCVRHGRSPSPSQHSVALRFTPHYTEDPAQPNAGRPGGPNGRWPRASTLINWNQDPARAFTGSFGVAQHRGPHARRSRGGPRTACRARARATSPPSTTCVGIDLRRGARRSGRLRSLGFNLLSGFFFGGNDASAKAPPRARARAGIRPPNLTNSRHLSDLPAEGRALVPRTRLWAPMVAPAGRTVPPSGKP